MALTDAKIRSLRAKKKRFIEWEDGRTGLGVRVSPAGRKTFIFMYRFEGKARMMSLGTYPQMHLALARRKSAEAKEKVSKGTDPGTELVKLKKAERDAETVADLAEEYLDKWARPRKRPRCAKEDERILNKDVLPHWGKRKAKDITRRDVIKLLDGIVDRPAPIHANRVLALLSKMFNFALNREIVETTPCAAITKPSKENKRDRVLSENEIKAFWEGLSSAKMSEGVRLALKLQLVTAQRKGEVVNAEWEEFDLHSGVWTIPAEKSKNNIPHRVPLSDMAVELLSEIRIQSKESRWLFPSFYWRSKDTPIKPNAVDWGLRRNRDYFPIEKFVPHDLRRSAASHMTSMGISRLVVSKILNHAEGGITSVYDRHSYDKEKRQALDTWGRKLDSIISGKPAGKVIELKR